MLETGIQYSSEDLCKLVKNKRYGGLTYRKIAQDLTALGIACKKGAHRWHPMMVKRIMGHVGTSHGNQLFGQLLTSL